MGTDQSSSCSPQIAWAFFLSTNNAAVSANAFSFRVSSLWRSLFLFCSSFRLSLSLFGSSETSSLALRHCFFQAFTSSTKMPFLLQYSASSVSLRVDVSSTTWNLSSDVHLLDDLYFVLLSLFLALLFFIHSYIVGLGIPSSSDRLLTVSVVGCSSLFSKDDLNSSVYLLFLF